MRYGQSLGTTIFAGDYFEERLPAFLDNLNTLYVAFTRSKEELLVFSPRPKKIKEETGEVEKISTWTDAVWAGRINALYILERTLNMKSVAVTDEVVCKTNSSGKKRVINRSETILAIEKQNKMIKMFQKWIWEDERRKERLEMIFENNFSCVRKRIFDGSFLRFPEIVPCIKAHF